MLQNPRDDYPCRKATNLPRVDFGFCNRKMQISARKKLCIMLDDSTLTENETSDLPMLFYSIEKNFPLFLGDGNV